MAHLMQITLAQRQYDDVQMTPGRHPTPHSGAGVRELRQLVTAGPGTREHHPPTQQVEPGLVPVSDQLKCRVFAKDQLRT